MIERKFVAQKFKEYEIEEFISNTLKRVGHSHTKMARTPMGEKITIHTSRPGLIVGKKGQNIKKLTRTLKVKFGLENPQIEIAEVSDINLNPQIVAEKISNSLERFGTSKFKGIGHKILQEVIGAGALGIEVIISGKIPSARAKKWRFYQGYLKKSGDIAVTQVKKAYAIANLKTGIVGIQVRIMTPDIILPDKIKIYDQMKTTSEQEQNKADNEAKEPAQEQEDKKTKKRKNPPKKKSQKKKKTDESESSDASQGSSQDDITQNATNDANDGAEDES